MIWLDLDPQVGHEQAGQRPALVLSHMGYNAKTGLAVVCPMTRQAKGYPFEVSVPGTSGGGVILADQIKTVDWRRRMYGRKGTVPAQMVEAVVDAIAELIA